MAIFSAFKARLHGMLAVVRGRIGRDRETAATIPSFGVPGMNAELRARIANRAHELWLLEGRPEGRDEEHWLQAEAEIGAGWSASASAPGRMPEDVRAALANAILARSFALERGQNVGDDVITTLAETRFEADQNSWTADKETAFWKCYLQLNSVLNPITIETVKAIRPETRKRTLMSSVTDRLGLRIFRSASPATIATRQYRVWGFVALVLVLFLQVYYAMGSSLLSDYDNLAQIAASDPSILVEKEQALPASLNEQKAAGSAGGQVIARTDNRLLAKPELIPINLTLAAKLNTIERLNQLNLIWLTLAPDVSDPRYKEVLSYGYLKLALDSIATYFLPLLYGLLGACAYIIRAVSVEIQQVRYSQETHTRFELRLFLGALAGLSVVWFVKPDDLQITIPTVALAFLAGYSVELVFVAMDRLVAAFGGEPQSRPVGTTGGDGASASAKAATS